MKTSVKRAISIRSPKDFWGGLFMLAVVAGVWLMLSDLSGMERHQLGVGTVPRLFTLFLGVMSAVLVIRSFAVDGPPLEPIRIRGPLMIVGAVATFSLAVHPLGLVLSSVAVATIATFARPIRRPIETIIFVITLVGFCVAVFKVGLGMQFHLWPRF